MPHKIRAVMFDLDGTLLDTAPDFIVVVNQLLEEENLAPLPAEEIRASVSNGSKALIRTAFKIDEDHTQFEPLRLRLLEKYLAHLAVFTAPFPGIQELLTQLGKHNIPWGIATNKPAVYTFPLMSALNLSPAPATIICPDHVHKSKPDPASLFLAAEQLNCAPEEIFYIGDHKRDIDCGRSAGSITMAVTFGYLDSGDDVSTWEANYICHHANEIWPIISDLI
jgi:2-phosphoglycolate phosphatase